MRSVLQYNLRPHIDCFAQNGFLVTLIDPVSQQRGQGFYLTKYDAVRAIGHAVHRQGMGWLPVTNFDAVYAPLGELQPLTTEVLRRLYTEVDIL